MANAYLDRFADASVNPPASGTIAAPQGSQGLPGGPAPHRGTRHHTAHAETEHGALWRGTAGSASTPQTERISRRSAHGHAPIIGITTDITHPADRPQSLRATCPLTYARSVAAAGGIPLLLPPILELIPQQLRACDGFVFTGGDDPRTEPFGVPTHPATTLVHPQRQEYETALLGALNAVEHRDTPVLGVCLGMQMMALLAGGTLNQHLPDALASAADHTGDRRHRVVTDTMFSRFSSKADEQSGQLTVTSHHHQAVEMPGNLSVVAVAHDGVIEGIADHQRRYYLGVQWHPERTDEPCLGLDLFVSLVQSAGGAASPHA